MADPDLAAIAEHPEVLSPVRDLLGDDPLLTAFVVYDRTPDGPGLPKHNDYKRWRPVGSSMHWLFTIVPFTDYDEEIGPLCVSPGSHRLDRVRDRGERALHVDPAVVPSDDSFIDPELARGDLLLMNMHTWHKAGPNRSKRARAGFFNKYAAKNYPPATGYYVYNDAAHAALSPKGQRVIAVHSDRPVSHTRMLLERHGRDGSEFLCLRDDTDRLTLPGGPTWREEAIPDWDHGNYIASLHDAMRKQLRVETPWATYVGDYVEGTELTRVYAYTLNDLGFPVPYPGEWLSADDLRSERPGKLALGYLPRALEDWQAPGIVRGKGISQAQARIDQYAY
jgi:hypothetical protein